MNDFHNAVKRVYDTIQASGTPMAVFHIDNELQVLPAKGGKFEMMFRDFRSGFVGVYDSACKLQMLKDDLL